MTKEEFIERYMANSEIQGMEGYRLALDAWESGASGFYDEYDKSKQTSPFKAPPIEKPGALYKPSPTTDDILSAAEEKMDVLTRESAEQREAQGQSSMMWGSGEKPKPVSEPEQEPSFEAPPTEKPTGSVMWGRRPSESEPEDQHVDAYGAPDFIPGPSTIETRLRGPMVSQDTILPGSNAWERRLRLTKSALKEIEAGATGLEIDDPAVIEKVERQIEDMTRTGSASTPVLAPWSADRGFLFGQVVGKQEFPMVQRGAETPALGAGRVPTDSAAILERTEEKGGWGGVFEPPPLDPDAAKEDDDSGPLEYLADAFNAVLPGDLRIQDIDISPIVPRTARAAYVSVTDFGKELYEKAQNRELEASDVFDGYGDVLKDISVSLTGWNQSPMVVLEKKLHGNDRVKKIDDGNLTVMEVFGQDVAEMAGSNLIIYHPDFQRAVELFDEGDENGAMAALDRMPASRAPTIGLAAALERETPGRTMLDALSAYSEASPVVDILKEPGDAARVFSSKLRQTTYALKGDITDMGGHPERLGKVHLAASVLEFLGEWSRLDQIGVAIYPVDAVRQAESLLSAFGERAEASRELDGTEEWMALAQNARAGGGDLYRDLLQFSYDGIPSNMLGLSQPSLEVAKEAVTSGLFLGDVANEFFRMMLLEADDEVLQNILNAAPLGSLPADVSEAWRKKNLPEYDIAPLAIDWLKKHEAAYGDIVEKIGKAVEATTSSKMMVGGTAVRVENTAGQFLRGAGVVSQGIIEAAYIPLEAAAEWANDGEYSGARRDYGLEWTDLGTPWGAHKIIGEWWTRTMAHSSADREARPGLFFLLGDEYIARGGKTSDMEYTALRTLGLLGDFLLPFEEFAIARLAGPARAIGRVSDIHRNVPGASMAKKAALGFVPKTYGRTMRLAGRDLPYLDGPALLEDLALQLVERNLDVGSKAPDGSLDLTKGLGGAVKEHVDAVIRTAGADPEKVRANLAGQSALSAFAYADTVAGRLKADTSWDRAMRSSPEYKRVRKELARTLNRSLGADRYVRRSDLDGKKLGFTPVERVLDALMDTRKIDQVKVQMALLEVQAMRAWGKASAEGVTDFSPGDFFSKVEFKYGGEGPDVPDAGALAQRKKKMGAKPKYWGLVPRRWRRKFIPTVYGTGLPETLVMDSRLRKLDGPSVAKETTAGGAEGDLAVIDNARQEFPNPAGDLSQWPKFMARVTGNRWVMKPPTKVAEYVDDPGILKEFIASATAKQLEDAGLGKQLVGRIKNLYDSGDASVTTTASLLLWSMLSRSVETALQEGTYLFMLDAGLDKYIRIAVEGKWTPTTRKDYIHWVDSVVKPKKGVATKKQLKALPSGEFTARKRSVGGARVNAGGAVADFLEAMSTDVKTGPYKGKTVLENIHGWMLDKSLSGREVRRRFFQVAPTGSQVDIKIFSFMLMVAGREDVIVLDRLQIGHLWDQTAKAEEYGSANVYDGFPSPGKEAKNFDAPERGWSTSRGMGDVMSGTRAIAVYEAIEDAMVPVLKKVYADLGRPEDGTPAVFHWESWAVSSDQEVGHTSLMALIKNDMGMAFPARGITVRHGKYDKAAYGTSMRIGADGRTEYIVENSRGSTFLMDAVQHDKFVGGRKLNATINKAIKQAFKAGKNDVKSIGFNQERPWYHQPGVDPSEFDARVAEFGREVDPASIVFDLSTLDAGRGSVVGRADDPGAGTGAPAGQVGDVPGPDSQRRFGFHGPSGGGLGLDELHDGVASYGTKPGLETQRAVLGAVGLKFDPDVDTGMELNNYPLTEVLGEDMASVEAALAKATASEGGHMSGWNYKIFGPERMPDGTLGPFVHGDFKAFSYHNKHAWIYQPYQLEASSGIPAHTMAWRATHEVAHGIVDADMTAMYGGQGARRGALGVVAGVPGLKGATAAPLSLADAMRALDWEDLAFRKQRQIMEEDLGVKITDEQFTREYQVNMADATMRVLTGEFSTPGKLGVVPDPSLSPAQVLNNAKDLLRSTAQEMGLDMSETFYQQRGEPHPEGVPLPLGHTKSKMAITGIRTDEAWKGVRSSVEWKKLDDMTKKLEKMEAAVGSRGMSKRTLQRYKAKVEAQRVSVYEKFETDVQSAFEGLDVQMLERSKGAWMDNPTEEVVYVEVTGPRHVVEARAAAVSANLEQGGLLLRHLVEEIQPDVIKQGDAVQSLTVDAGPPPRLATAVINFPRLIPVHGESILALQEALKAAGTGATLRPRLKGNKLTALELVHTVEWDPEATPQIQYERVRLIQEALQKHFIGSKKDVTINWWHEDLVVASPEGDASAGIQAYPDLIQRAPEDEYVGRGFHRAVPEAGRRGADTGGGAGERAQVRRLQRGGPGGTDAGVVRGEGPDAAGDAGVRGRGEGGVPSRAPGDAGGALRGGLAEGQALPPVVLRETTDLAAFEAAKAANKRSENLAPKTAVDYENAKAFLSEDKDVGILIQDDGTLGNLFNNSGIKGSGVEAMLYALENSDGRVGDAFDPFLPEYYAKFGFEEVARLKFDDDYAPDGWDYKANGRPDIVFVAYVGGDRSTLRSRYGTFEHKKTDVYVEDYDEGYRLAHERADAANALAFGRPPALDAPSYNEMPEPGLEQSTRSPAGKRRTIVGPLKWIEGNSQSDYNRMLSGRLIEIAMSGDPVYIRVIEDADWASVYPDSSPTLAGALGTYRPDSHDIDIRAPKIARDLYGDEIPSPHGLNEEVILHEVLHAATVKNLRTTLLDPEGASPSARRAVQDLLYLQKEVRHQLLELSPDLNPSDLDTMPMFETAEEFITYGLTSAKFQKVLLALKVPGENVTMWSRFVEGVARLLGLAPDVAFVRLLDITERIADSARTVPPRRVIDVESGGLAMWDRPSPAVDWLTEMMEEMSPGRDEPLYQRTDGQPELPALRDKRPVAETEWFHGTRADFETFSDFDPIYHGNPQALFGFGLYLTDEPTIAKGYSVTKRGGSTGRVLKVDVDDLNTLDLDAPLPDEAYQAVARTVDGLESSPEKLGREVIQDLREHLEAEGFSTSEAVDVLGELAGVFEDLGYQGLRHVGGRTGRGAAKGAPEHNVLVVFDPADMYVPFKDGEPVRAATTKAHIVADVTDEPLYQPERGRGIRGQFHVDDKTGRYIITLFDDADFTTLWHENGHLARFLLEEESPNAMDIFTDVFDSTTKDGVRVLTVEGEEQIARAWEYYLETGGAPTGSVMMLFEALKKAIADLWDRLRGYKKDDSRVTALFDHYTGFHRSVEMEARVVARDVRFRGGFDSTTVPITKAGRVTSEMNIKKNKAKEAGRIDMRKENILSKLGIDEKAESVNAYDLYTSAVRYVASEMGRSIFTEKMVVLTRNSVVPAGRLKRIEAAVKAKMAPLFNSAEKSVGGSYGSHIWRINMDRAGAKVGGSSIKDAAKTRLGMDSDEVGGLDIRLDAAAQARLRTLANELSADPVIRLKLDKRWLDPTEDISTISIKSFNNLVEGVVDSEAGFGTSRTRYSTDVPLSAVRAAARFFKSGVEHITAASDEAAKVKNRYGKLFKTHRSLESDKGPLVNPPVQEAMDRAGRALGEIHDWFVRIGKLGEGGPMGVLDALHRSLIDQLSLPYDAVRYKELGVIHTDVFSGESNFDKMAKSVDRVSTLLSHRRRYSQPPAELIAIDSIRLLRNRRDRAFQAHVAQSNLDWVDDIDADARVDPASTFEFVMTDEESKMVKDAHVVLGNSIHDRLSAGDGRVDEIAQAFSGTKGPPLLERFERQRIYESFENGDWEDIADWMVSRGFTAGMREDRLPTYNFQAAIAQAIVRMRAQQILGEMWNELSEIGVNLKVSEWFPIEDDVPYGANLEDFKQRVLTQLNMISQWRDSVQYTEFVPGSLEVHRGPGPSDALPLSKEDAKILRERGDIKDVPYRDRDEVKASPMDMAARNVAMDLYEQLGFKVSRNDWVIGRFPDGSEAFMPEVMKTELDAALDRASGKLGTSYSKGTMPGDPTWAKREVPVHAQILSGKATDQILSMFPRYAHMIRQGITTGFFWMVNTANYVANAMGGILQMYQVLGMKGTAAGLSKPQMTMAVTARMFGDGVKVPGSPPVVDRFGRIYTAEEVYRLAKEEGLDTSLIKSETARSLAQDLARLNTGKYNPIKAWWFSNKLLIESSTAIDNYYRVGTFISRLEMGEAPTQAAEIARKALLDYNDLTDFEKGVMRNVVMFYSYARKNMDLTWDTMLDNPSRLLGQIRVMRGLKKEFFQDEPEIVENDWLAMRFPFYFADLAVPDQMYSGVMVTPPPFPYQDSFGLVFDIFDTATQFLTGGGRAYLNEEAGAGKLLSRLTPWAQAPLIASTGFDPFAGTELLPKTIPNVLVAHDLFMNDGALMRFFGAKPVLVNPERAATPGQMYEWRVTDEKKLWRWWAFRSMWPLPFSPRIYDKKGNIDLGVNVHPAGTRMLDTAQQWSRADVPLADRALSAAMKYAGGGDIDSWREEFTREELPFTRRDDGSGYDTETHRPWAAPWMEKLALTGIKSYPIRSYYGIYLQDNRDAQKKIEEARAEAIKGVPELQYLR